MSVQANAIVNVVIDGVSYGRWDTKSGGGRTADITRHRPGGQLEEILLGGLPTSDAVTLDRVYDRARDHQLLITLPAKVGFGQVTLSWQPTDGSMVPTSDAAVTYSGVLSGFTPPEYDSTSADAPRLEITVDIV